MTMLLSNRTLFGVIGVDPVSFFSNETLKGGAILAAHAARSGANGGEACFFPFRIKAADVVRNFHKLGSWQSFEVFDDGF